MSSHEKLSIISKRLDYYLRSRTRTSNSQASVCGVASEPCSSTEPGSFVVCSSHDVIDVLIHDRSAIPRVKSYSQRNRLPLRWPEKWEPARDQHVVRGRDCVGRCEPRLYPRCSRRPQEMFGIPISLFILISKRHVR